MEEQEVPLEKVHEHIEHHAHMSQEKWVSWVALSTAILAAFAAVASLMAGDHANEAMITQIQSSDNWNYYQAKGIKAAVLETRMELLEAMGKTPGPELKEKAEKYAKEQAEIQKEAQEKAKESSHHLGQHVTLALSTTMFQISIAVSAISILTKKSWFFFGSLVLGGIGVALLAFGFWGFTWA